MWHRRLRQRNGMTGRLLNFVTALSLLLAVVVCVQWRRGYRVQDYFSVARVVGTAERPVEQRFGVVTCTGAFWFSADSSAGNASYDESIFADWRRRLGAGWAVRWRTYSNPHYPSFETGWVHRFGFHASRRDSPGDTAVDVVVPTWFALACTTALPAARLLAAGRRRLRAGRRSAAGLCPSCGYDLTANESGTCPECGMPKT